MAYDPVRDGVLLVGGTAQSGGWLTDTWLWNGVSWTELPVPGPVAMSGSKLAFDSARGVAVLVGDQRDLGFSTWEFDGSVWRRVPSQTLPSLRDYHLAYDAARNEILLCGTTTPPVSFIPAETELWRWTGADWLKSQSTAPSPGPRASVGLAYDTARGLIVFGGGYLYNTSNEYVNDLWEWDGAQWQASPVGTPTLGQGGAMAYDTQKRSLVIYGGAWSAFSQQGFYDYTWSSRWSSPTGTGWQLGTASPSARAWHAMAYDPRRNQLVMFGGMNSNFTSLAETWIRECVPTCPTDFNCSGTVTIDDLFEFIAAWFRRDPRTDVDSVGGIAIDDIFVFLARWFATSC